jgi:hypothetical protein
MANVLSRKAMLALVGAGSAMIASTVVDQALDAAWRRLRDDEPPRDPSMPGFSWPVALLWTIGSATAVGVAQLAARRGAAAGWKKTVGKKRRRSR